MASSNRRKDSSTLVPLLDAVDAIDDVSTPSARVPAQPEEDACPICLGEVDAGRARRFASLAKDLLGAVRTHCGHVFCVSCLAADFAVRAERGDTPYCKCPMCRRDVVDGAKNSLLNEQLVTTVLESVGLLEAVGGEES